MRDYTVYYDTGTDFCEKDFSSDYRAGSKRNMEDAKAAIRKSGKRAYGYQIIKIERVGAK